MRVAWSVGHSEKVRGMRGSPVPPECDEVDECLKISTDVCALLEKNGVECPMFFDTTSTSQSQYLANINNWTNSQNADLAVSCHLNAGGGDGPVGCEVWYYTQKTLAAKVATAMAEALGLPDRGPKYSSSLSFLVNTNPPAILLECFFGDSRTDCAAYAEQYDALVMALAESVGGIDIDEDIDEPEPPEPEQPPEVISEDNRVIIDTQHEGDVTIYVNDMLTHGHEGCEHVVRFKVKLEGDVVLVVNGEGFHNQLPPPSGEAIPPLQPLTQEQQAAISEIAFGSEIADYNWQDRGQAPIGYMLGMALSFAQTYRKLMAGHPAVIAMAKARTDSDKDALNLYRGDFERLGMSNEEDGIDTLRHLYALLLGHGMRESSGRHCEGRDLSADNVQSDTAEAGLFQTSWNAHSASDPEFTNLMDEYSDPANTPICYLSHFDDDVECSPSEWGSYGSGDGRAFQDLCKVCPAFAVESCALTLRNLANHYGPIIRHETELKAEAEALFRQVQDYMEAVA